jgi:ATP-dependent Lhr-like helicase
VTEFEQLHPSIQYHVVNTLGWSTLRPTQLQAIAPIHAGTHCLLLAPTAGGKTEAATIPVLSRMLKESWPGTSVLYVCPIKALLNNLEHRLTRYAGLVGRRVEVWHGDVSQSKKSRALKDAPDILLTTPESIEAMLISTRVDRPAWFGNLHTVIVDELHAFASDDRGWHLRSILYRLDRYLKRPLQRIGLSATVSNPDELLGWFAPAGERAVVGSASVSTEAEVTLDHVASLENAATVIARLHRGEKRLVFCDSRSAAERLSNMLREQEVRTFVSHASLSAAQRRQAEAAFSEEKECVIVATSTLELGIDVGDLDRVVQIDAPPTVSSFLQRMGRTGRRAGSLRNCLFLTTNGDAFLLALGIVQKWSEHWVEAAMPPPEPWHIVAQQALTVTLEQGRIPAQELLTTLQAAFPELAKGEIGQLLEHLIDRQYLSAEEAVIQVGPTTEREFGQSHYRELMASFSGTVLLTGKHGSAEVGYIDPSVLIGSSEKPVLLLGGRSWQVTAVEWSKKTVWLEPVAYGGKARWSGGARSIGREVSQGIRAALSAGAPEVVAMSRRAKSELTILQEELPIPPDIASVFICSTDGIDRTWTFAGTRANRTLAYAASTDSTRLRFNELSVAARVVPQAMGVKPNELLITAGEQSTMAKSIKFSDCVPAALLKRMLLSRNFD